MPEDDISSPFPVLSSRSGRRPDSADQTWLLDDDGAAKNIGCGGQAEQKAEKNGMHGCRRMISVLRSRFSVLGQAAGLIAPIRPGFWTMMAPPKTLGAAVRPSRRLRRMGCMDAGG